MHGRRQDLCRSALEVPSDLGIREAAPARRRMNMPVTVASLLSRRLPVEWFEAVALAQAICAQMLSETRLGETGVPNPEDIAILPNGDVDFLAVAPPVQSPVFRVACLVEMLVSLDQAPEPFRLLLLQLLSPDPPFHTVLELTRALDYYERPNRGELVEDLYRRCAEEPREKAAPVVLLLPLAPAILEPLPAPKWYTRRTFLRPAAAVTGGLALLAAGWWGFTRPEGTWLGDERRVAASMTKQTAERVGDSWASGVDSVRRQLGYKASQPPSPAAAPMAMAGAAVLPRVAPGPTELATRPVVPPGAQGDVARFAPALPDPSAPLPLSPSPEEVWSALPAVPLADVRIYDRNSSGVVPAMLLSPRLRATAPAGTRVEDYPLLEVTVSAAGEVEGVRVLSRAVGWRDSMLLSSVKAWAFRPATKGGQPVRYRHVVRLINP